MGGEVMGESSFIHIDTRIDDTARWQGVNMAKEPTSLIEFFRKKAMAPPPPEKTREKPVRRISEDEVDYDGPKPRNLKQLINNKQQEENKKKNCNYYP